MIDSEFLDMNDILDTLDELARVFDELTKTGKTLEESLAKFSGGISDLSRETGGSDESSFGSLDRLGNQLTDSIHGSGRALYNGDLGDMGSRILRNFAGKLGDDLSDYFSDALGGGFFADLFGGILGELVRGIEGLFGNKKKLKLPEVNLEELFNPPEMLTLPEFALPTSTFYSGRYTDSASNGDVDSSRAMASVNVTVNGVVGSPRDVADEIGRIVTRTLADLNRRGA
jgi:hypothetical protein